MDLEKLRVFYHVARMGRVLEASKFLQIAQPGVTKHINDLEASLNSKLFHRSHGGVELTEDGKILFEFAQMVVERSHVIEDQIMDRNRLIEGTLKIATTSGSINFWLAKAAADFMGKYPNLRISLIAHDSNQPIPSSEADVMIRPFLNDRSDLAQHLVYRYEIGMYASREYIEKYGQPKKIEDLVHHRLISFYTDHNGMLGDIDYLVALIRKEEPNYQTYISVNSSMASLEVIKYGTGIGPFSRDYIQKNNPELIEILPEIKGPEINLYYIHDVKLENSKRISSFCKFLQQKFNLD